MIGEKLGHVFDKPLEGLARKIPISPNSLTIIGFVVTLGASIVLVTDLFLGGMLILLGALFDVLDGVVARATHRVTRFGAFLDSVLDRYSDALMFLAIAFNLLRNSNRIGAGLAVVALVGAFLVSYVRARAEGLGVECKVGLMERPERIILLVFGLLSGMIMPVLWILTVLNHVTAAQRIYYVRNLSSSDTNR